MQSGQPTFSVLFQYAARLRQNGHSDEDLVRELQELEIPEQVACDVTKALNESGVTADGNRHPNAVGWACISCIVVITASIAFLLVSATQPYVFKSVIVIVSVALGFGIHVAAEIVMERFGISTSTVVPVAVPTKSEILAQLELLRGAEPE